MDQILDSHTTEENISLEYAGFWIRFVAAFIDGILLAVVQQILILVVTGGTSFSGVTPGIGVSIINLLIGISYHVIMESSAKQGTLGKMAMGIKIGDENGNRITPGRAIGRYFSKLLSALILLIGYIMVAFDDRKQGLHDKIAGTVVYYGRS